MKIKKLGKEGNLTRETLLVGDYLHFEVIIKIQNL